MHFDVLTLFPPMIEVPLGQSVIGRAQRAGVFSLGVHDLRPFGLGRHQTVDDAPYGGGSGMVMRVDVLAEAIRSLRRPDSHIILFEPSGARFDQAAARRLTALPHLVMVCGHYEGVDARVRAHLVDETLSIGDYVLTGGEYAALVVIDAVARLLPGALGNAESVTVESFTDASLEAPHYTRPRVWEGHEVPEILVSGHHARVEAWRREQAMDLTRRVRPELVPDPPPPADPPRRRARTRPHPPPQAPSPPPDDDGPAEGNGP